jgi:Protein of unknown function (DUF2846)
MTNYCNKGQILRLLLFMIFPLTVSSQTLSCHDIKNGVFIYFSKNDGSKSTYTRTGEVQKEFNGATRETVLWDVEWINDCSYYLKYNSGAEDKSKQELDILKKHKFLFNIVSVSEDYYVFESYVDKSSNPLLFKDTLWIKQRRDAKNKVISNPRIDSLLAQKKVVFDSSLNKSATLYIFRPGKFVESLETCTIYYNDTAICVMTNKAAYVVRLLKEGPAKFTARIGKKEMEVMLDIQYGKKYFLRCEIKWAVPGRPILTKSDLDEARAYFTNIK